MIESLHITNYVLIEKLDLVFSSGLIAITGETGSGKSIILGALSLLLGAKADRNDVRKGCDKTEISGVFSTSSSVVKSWLDERDISYDDGNIIIRRVIKSEGKSIYTVNGSPITIKEGEDLGYLLVDFTAQNSHHSLLKKDVQREILDTESGTREILEEYRKAYFLLEAAIKKKEETEKLIKSGKEEQDYMSYCLSEIDSAAIEEGEEEETREKLAKEAGSEFILENIENAISDIKSASTELSSSLSSISNAMKKDKDLEGLYSRLESAQIEIDDIKDTLLDYSHTLFYDESEIEQMNQRLSLIQRIKRRYGGTIESVKKTQKEYREKLELISDSSDMLSSLLEKIEKYKEEVEKKGEELTLLREKGAENLGRKIENKLHDLMMENAEFKIRISPSDYSPYGKDSIEYLIRANKGERITDIENSASGGELSRIMLAIKVSSNATDGVETICFDEIDTGLGGMTAGSVAEELSRLGKKSQVIVITHIARIASQAKEHLFVEKIEDGERTISSIREIKGDERIEETARLLSGDTSTISLSHARELLKS